MKFDVIIGNPPYQPPSEKSNGLGNGSRNKIWHKFIEKGFEILNDNGIISMITPNNWHIGNFTNGVHKKAQNLMWNNRILCVKDAKSHFSNVGYSINIDYWIIKKDGTNSIEIDIPNEYKDLMLIPKNINNEIVKSFFISLINEKEFIYMDVSLHDHRSYSCIPKSKNGDTKHLYPHLNSFAQFEKGLLDWYDSETDGLTKSKVIIFGSGKIGPIYDKYGKYGTGDGAFAYTVEFLSKKEIDMLIKLFKSDVYCTIKSEFTQEKAFRNPIQLFKKIPKKWLKENFGDK